MKLRLMFAIAVVSLLAIPALADDPALAVTITPWVETAFSARTTDRRTTAGGELRFDGFIPISETQDPDRWRLRVNLNLSANASTLTGQEFNLTAPATWGRYAEVSFASYGKVRKVRGATLDYYVGWGFQTAIGDRLAVADRFFRYREAGFRLADSVNELVFTYSYDDRLPAKHGIHIKGTVPIPGLQRAVYLIGDAILGFSGGGDQLLIRIGVNMVEFIQAAK